jgi:hypothetical protein
MRYLIFFILIFGFGYLKSESAGRIYSVDNPSDTLVHLGPCYILDTLQSDIFLGNTGDIDLFMDGQSPSLIIFASPNQQSTLEFIQFDRKYPGMNPSNPFVLPAGEDALLGIEYIPSNPLVNPLGINEANIQVALLSVADASIAEKKTFLFRVNKTDKYLAGFDNEVFFDSVYVNPVIDKPYLWKVRSTWQDNIIVTSQQLLAQNIQAENEFYANQADYPLEFDEKYKTMSWEIFYSPKNPGQDSSDFILTFKPDEINFPDSTEKVNLRTKGIGVEQKLHIINSNFDFSSDTINIGEVKLGKRINVTVDLENSGNINIKSVAEVLFEEQNDIQYSDYEIQNPFSVNGILQPDSVRNLQFDFTPLEYGRFVYRYVMRTDIMERNIFGVPPSAENIEFYIRGRGKAPKLNIESDTVDFKNVILNSIDCPSERDTVFRIANNGNEELRIIDVITNPPFPQSKFRVFPKEIILQPEQDTTIKITFISNNSDINRFAEEMIIITNQYPPNDSISVILIAETMPAVEANLSIPANYFAKPGSNISLPLLIKNQNDKPSKYATSFKSLLRYNHTILDYKGFSSINTAAEKSIVTINTDESGELDISLKDDLFFNPNDTLLILNFDVYLGNSPSSELLLINPVFGDNNCYKIMNTTVNNGNVILDSICGIEFKALPFDEQNISFAFNMRDYKSGEAIFEIPYDANVKIEIYDIYGNISKFIDYNTMQTGFYYKQIDMIELSSGVYFIRFYFDRFAINKKIILGF